MVNLTKYVEILRGELAVAAEAGGDEARALAERLTAPLESAVRLVLLEVLSAAADEITVELAPGSVEVRLRGMDPEFVVTLPPSDRQFGANQLFEDVSEGSFPASIVPGESDEGGTWRTTLRLPEHFKPRIEEAAGRDGISVNAWHVRAAASALESNDRNSRAGRRDQPGGQRFTGWVR